MRRILLVLLALSLGSIGLAQCPEFLGVAAEPVEPDTALSPETLFGDPICLLRETQTFIGNDSGIGLFRLVDRLADVLFVLFTGVAVVNLAARRSLELAIWFLAKLFLVGMVLGLHVETRDLAKETWYRTYEFSDSVWRMDGGVADQLKTAIDDAQVLLPTTFGLVGIVKTGGRKLYVRTASEGIESQAGRRARRMLNWAPTLLNIMLYTFLPVIFIYGALIYLSGVQLLLFLVFWKFAVAFLMLPGGGLGIMRRLSAIYLAALLKVLWLPFMFGILIDLILRQPLRRFSTHLQAGIGSVNDAVADLNARMPRNFSSFSPRQWQAWLESIPATVMDSLGGVLTIVIGWVLGFLMMLVLLGVGIWLMQQTSGIITSVVGGFGGSGAVPNPVAKTIQMIQQRHYVEQLKSKSEGSQDATQRGLPSSSSTTEEPRRNQPPPQTTKEGTYYKEMKW